MGLTKRQLAAQPSLRIPCDGRHKPSHFYSPFGQLPKDRDDPGKVINRNRPGSIGCDVAGSPMRQRQPRCKLLRRFLRRLPVKRHHRRRHAREATELGAPAVADGRDLNEVRTPCNDFFEMMNVHGMQG